MVGLQIPAGGKGSFGQVQSSCEPGRHRILTGVNDRS
jgi:hypothetical protein